MKRIVIIDHFSKAPGETGNNRFIYLAELLCSCGFAVEIITTTFAHIAKRQRDTDAKLYGHLPYKYTMLPEPGYPRNVCLKRFASHRVFGANLSRYLQTMEKPDAVLVAVPSLDVGKAAGNYCRKHGIPFLVDIQDLWPEAFKLLLKLPVISDLAFLPMTLQANRFYSQADRIIAVSRTYQMRGLRSNRKDPEGLCVYLGTDLEQFDKYRARSCGEKPRDELWIGYAGTLGHSYNIEIIFDALNLLPDVLGERVVFHVFGDGPYLERFREYARGCKVRSVFHGRQDYPTMVSCLSQADIAVNPIAKGAAQSIINKHADYAAAGLPVVSTQECREYRDLLEHYQCGINCDVESAEQVAAALRELIEDPDKRKRMGENSRRMAEERFDRRNTYRQIVRAIEDVTR